jgi:hypothetical protein
MATIARKIPRHDMSLTGDIGDRRVSRAPLRACVIA